MILDQPIQQSGGMMTLTDAFVRVNRARGLELVSPDDVLSAAQSLKDTHIPMRLHQFQSGVFVLMTSNYSDEEIRQDMMNQVLTSFFLVRFFKIRPILIYFNG